MLLDVGAAEDAPAQLGSIIGSLLLPEQRIRLDQDSQGIPAYGHTAFDEMQIETYTARCDEPPCPDLIRRPVRTDSTAEVEVSIALCHFEPQVALRVRLIAAG
jgi:hypothetical protein